MTLRTFFSALVIALLVSGTSEAQTWPFELWHEGKIVLNEGDTLRGLVKYDQQQDLVQYNARDDKAANIFTARKVMFFEIFDNTVHRYRKFFTLPYTTAGQYKAPLFFELLAEGTMTLLSREYLEFKNVSSPYYMGGAYSRQVLTNRYFFLKEDGSITEFIGKKNDLIDMMGKNGSDVNKYIKANRLRFEEKNDMIRIVDYYNSLVDPK